MSYLKQIALDIAAENTELADKLLNKQIQEFGQLTASDVIFITKEVASIKRIWAMEEAEFRSHLSKYNV